MKIEGNRLMASTIEEVIENPSEQTVTFRLMFPTDFAHNIFEERFLKFTEVIYYSVDEIIIPIGRTPQINLIIDKGEIKKTKPYGAEATLKNIIRKRFEIQTTVGMRHIEFSEYYFFDDKKINEC